jgi:hypothetical protein
MKKLLVVCGFLAAGFANGGAIFTNGSVDSTGGNEMTEWIQANPFTLTVSDTITEIVFDAFTASLSNYNGSINWGFYSDDAGSPGTLLSTDVQTMAPVDMGPAALGGFELYQFDFVLTTPFSATGGTQYWLGLHNGPLADTTRSEFYLANSTSGGGGFEQDLGGSTFSPNEDPHFFVLEDGGTSTPEPSTFALLGLGGLAVIGMRRLRATRSN